MVKKKRQSDPGENGDDSTESCDESVKSGCPHVAKAVDLTRLKKTLRLGGFEKECSECKKSGAIIESDPNFEEDHSLWMCLRCGTQLCGRARNKHALNHFNTPHSDCHSLTTNTTSWEVYCYICNNEVTPSSSKKLHECIEYIKKLASGNATKPLPPITLYAVPTEEEIIKTEPIVKGKDKAMALNLPRVRGLSNLGNTCFFNSVMQCLVQTPYLLDVLQEMATPGERFTLPGGKLKLKGEGKDDEGTEVDLPAITGELAEWGPLTRTLAETLSELQSGEGGVHTPRKLLSSLVYKLPQFGGGDQHDAHELLRHLLEAVRSEDLRRYQSVILNRLGMSQKVDPAKVDEEVKQKVKFYGQQASDTMLRPEQVFRGFLVSTLECQDCFNQSERAEYFLDLSLPVAATRHQPPALVRRKTPNEENTYNTQEKNHVSKHLLKKKEIEAAKAARRRKDRKHEPSAKQNSPAETNGKADDNASSSESDADVEDNLEETPHIPPPPPLPHTAQNFAAYHMESGYSSDKHSPVRATKNGEEEKTGDTPENPDKDAADSGVASPDARHRSTETVNDDSPSIEPEPERPVSRCDFVPETCNNEVVERGISLRGSRTVLDNESDADRAKRELTDAFRDWKLGAGGGGPRAASPAPPAPRALPAAPPSPRYVYDEDDCSVHSCLSQFTALELLTGNNKVACDHCTKRINGENGKNVYTNATKRFLVSSPPAVLILHLKRFQLGPRCMFRKMSKHVDFQTVLDLAPFCAMDKVRRLTTATKTQNSLLYSLYGVVEHSGGMHGGHYVAYVKVRSPVGRSDPRRAFLPRSGPAAGGGDAQRDSDSELSGYESGDTPSVSPPPPPAGTWYYVSDSMVSEVSEDKVLRAQAYLLFYERIL